MIKNKLILNEKIVYIIAMSLFSFSIIALETIYFHMLMIVSNYIKATFIISIAMLGIAIGSLISFYLLKLKMQIVLILSTLLFFASIIFSYNNIINIGEFRYPYLLILPFIFGTVIISSIFSKTESNTVYFINLVASAIGVLFPIISVSLVKSENSLVILLFVPIIFIAVLSFSFENIFISIILKIVPIIAFIMVFNFLKTNLSLPEMIHKSDFETKIIPKMRDKYDTNFIKRTYENKGEYYTYSDKSSQYDKLRAKYLLNQIGYLKDIDLNYNVKRDQASEDLYKIYNNGQRILFSEDNLLGRVELLGDDEYMNFSVDGVILDGIDSYNGAVFDPRVPHLDNANVFIVGLSADGIAKSAKRLKNSRVSGIEINPIVLRIMQEDKQFANFACRPYDKIEVHSGEGRSFLETTTQVYDMITLMNIHMEHGPNCTLSPEYFHTIEGTKLLLNKISDRGYVVYEEIIMNDRSKFAFYKFMNTAIKSMKDMGIDDPLNNNIIVFAWDFWGSWNAFRTVVIKKTPFTKMELLEFNNYLDVLKTNWYPSLDVQIFPNKNINSSLEVLLKNNTQGLTYIPESLNTYSFTHDITKKIKNADDLSFISSKYKFNGSNRYNLNYLNEEDKNRLKEILKGIDYPVEIDFSPATDDKPFPFDVYQNKKEVKDILYIILILTLILFIPILILLLTKIKEYKFNLPLQIIFFAVMGFGYMLVEIVLMQKYQRFIGAPTYSMIVVLGGLLLFSGIGSFVSRFFSKKITIIALALIPVLLFLKLNFLNDIFIFFGKYSFTSKLFISALLLFPLTFLMGIPFPHALESIKKHTSNEYATLMFGVSGAFSTIGSTSSIMISVTYGFSISFIIGILCYIVGIPLFTWIMLKKT